MNIRIGIGVMLIAFAASCQTTGGDKCTQETAANEECKKTEDRWSDEAAREAEKRFDEMDEGRGRLP